MAGYGFQVEYSIYFFFFLPLYLRELFLLALISTVGAAFMTSFSVACHLVKDGHFVRRITAFILAKHGGLRLFDVEARETKEMDDIVPLRSRGSRLSQLKRSTTYIHTYSSGRIGKKNDG